MFAFLSWVIICIGLFVIASLLEEIFTIIIVFILAYHIAGCNKTEQVLDKRCDVQEEKEHRGFGKGAQR